MVVKNNKSIILDDSVVNDAQRHLREVDPLLAEVINTHGPCDICSDQSTLFEKLVDSIISQQLSAKAARTIRLRITERISKFEPQFFLDIDIESLRSAGLSYAKIKYIRGLSEMVIAGQIDFDELRNLNQEDAVSVLTKIPGIGRWTAEMFLLFALRHSDILAVDDVGLQRAAKKLYGEKAMLHKLGKRWHPYCSVASWYLWRYLDSNIMTD